MADGYEDIEEAVEELATLIDEYEFSSEESIDKVIAKYDIPSEALVEAFEEEHLCHPSEYKVASADPETFEGELSDAFDGPLDDDFFGEGGAIEILDDEELYA